MALERAADRTLGDLAAEFVFAPAAMRDLDRDAEQLVFEFLRSRRGEPSS